MSDGHWRVKTNEDSVDNEGFAQTKQANLNRPYGGNCSWKVKCNMLDESGMEPAPDLQVIALDDSETALRKVRGVV